MQRYAILYSSTLVVMGALDLLFLGFLAKGFFQSNVGEMMKEPNFFAAAMFYLLYTAGIVVFVNGSTTASWQQTLLCGAFFGLLCYGTFDLTCMSIIKGWKWNVALVDMSWGMVATGISGTLGMLMTRAGLKLLAS